MKLHPMQQKLLPGQFRLGQQPSSRSIVMEHEKVRPEAIKTSIPILGLVLLIKASIRPNSDSVPLRSVRLLGAGQVGGLNIDLLP